MSVEEVGATILLAVFAGAVVVGLVFLASSEANAYNSRACIEYGTSQDVEVRYVGGVCEVQVCGNWIDVDRLKYHIQELDCQP